VKACLPVEPAVSLRESGVKSLIERFPDHPIVAMGDWNRRPRKLQAMLARMKLPSRILPVSGSAKTYHIDVRPVSAIDHMVHFNPGAAARCLHSKVLRNWKCSDHWPLRMTFQLPVKAPAPQSQNSAAQRASLASRRILTNKLADEKASIVHDNYWQVLMSDVIEVPEEHDLDAVVQSFVDTSKEVAKEHDVLSTPPTRPGPAGRQQPYCSAATKRAIEKKRRAYKKWRKAPNSARLGEEFQRLKAKASKCARQDRNARWHKFIAEGMDLLQEKDFKGHWRWINRVLNRRKGATHLQPMKDPADGSWATDTSRIAQIWAGHYGKLASDPTTHSKDAGYWQRFQLPQQSALPDLNNPISSMDFKVALKSLKNGKAAGGDGIPPEWLRMCIPQEVDGVDLPLSPMARCVLSVVQRIWDENHIPQLWRSARIVSIFKKGDPAEVNNYRGISLISVGLKVLCMIVINRISRQLEAEGRLRREQAGFRPAQECVAQAATLVEILQRRRARGQTSFVTFLDLQKAFDTVPHEAMLHKLSAVGVRGHVLEFLRAIYGSSSIGVASPEGEHTAELLRGVRQGCPMSPLLFDIFIDDLLADVDPHGVTIPAIPNSSISGLLFADDAATLNPSPQAVRASMAAVERWADKWEMKFGVAKCGIMVVEPPRVLGVSVAEQSVSNIFLQGEKLPVVDHYIYLGVKLTRDLSFDAMVAHRLGKFRGALMGLRAFLRCRSIPLSVRVNVLKVMALPVFLYGAEIWGMNQERVAKAQLLLNQGIRWLVGTSAHSTAVPLAAAQRELQIPPMHAMASARRARGFEIFPRSKAWVSSLLESPLRAVVAPGLRTWLTSTRAWIKRFDKDKYNPEGANLYERTMSSTWYRRDTRKNQSRAFKDYKLFGLDEEGSNLWWKHLPRIALHLGQGFTYLLQCRLHCVWTARKYAVCKILPARFLTYCPLCRQTGPRAKGEDMSHLLLECIAWHNQRTEFLAPYLGYLRSARVTVGPASTRSLSNHEILYLTLGGRRDGVSRGPVHWIGPSPRDDPSTGQNFCVAVASFLQSVMPMRMIGLKAILPARVLEEGADCATDRRPDG